MLLDSGVFSEMQRAAQLSSAAYTGCTGSAFDVTITKQINDIATDTQVRLRYSITESSVSSQADQSRDSLATLPLMAVFRLSCGDLPQVKPWNHTRYVSRYTNIDDSP